MAVGYVHLLLYTSTQGDEYQISVIALEIASVSSGHIMPPYISPQGVRVNAVGYINVLKTDVKLWLDKVWCGRPSTFQQDSAVSYKAIETTGLVFREYSRWCESNMRPQNSPLNTMDYYYVWSVIERETNRYLHSTIVSLKAAIVQVRFEINREHLISACGRFRPRTETVIETKGNFQE